MTIVYLVRHGETLWNTMKRIQGWSDSPLTDKGIYEAKLLAKRMENVHIDAIYSSSSGRAFKTAEVVKGTRTVQVIPNDNLREINLGKWEGKDQEILKEEYSEEYVNFWTKPHLFKPIGGESFLEVQKRVTSEINKIVLENENKVVLIVAHTVAIKVALAYYENRPMSQLWDPPHIKHTSLSRVDFNDGDAKISINADASHLNENAIENENKVV